MNNKIIPLSVFAMVILFFTACKQQPSTDLTKAEFIPKPVSVKAAGGSFKISGSTKIYYQEGTEGLQQVAEYLSEELNNIAMIKPVVQVTNKIPRKGIYLTITNEDSKLGNEGYELIIGKKLIIINATAPSGNFYGIQTLL